MAITSTFIENVLTGPGGFSRAVVTTYTYTDAAGDTGNAYATAGIDTWKNGYNTGVSMQDSSPPIRTMVNVKRTDANGTALDGIKVYGSAVDPSISVGDAVATGVVIDQAPYGTNTIGVTGSATQNWQTSASYEGHDRFLAVAVDSIAAAVSLTITITRLYV